MKLPTAKQALHILGFGLFFLFLIQNLAMVEINFLFWSMRLPRALVYVLIFGLGIIVARVGKSYRRV